jgi:hypothetical protein
MTPTTIVVSLAVAGLGLAAGFILGQRKEQNKSKNWTIKEEVIDADDRTPAETQFDKPTIEEQAQPIQPEPTPELFPITQAIVASGRGEGTYNKLVAQMRFEGFQTLYTPVSGYNSNVDLSPIKNNPDQKFAVILDEIQTNTSMVDKIQEELVEFDTDNVRLYTIEYQA